MTENAPPGPSIPPCNKTKLLAALMIVIKLPACERSPRASEEYLPRQKMSEKACRAESYPVPIGGPEFLPRSESRRSIPHSRVLHSSGVWDRHQQFSYWSTFSKENYDRPKKKLDHRVTALASHFGRGGVCCE